MVTIEQETISDWIFQNILFHPEIAILIQIDSTPSSFLRPRVTVFLPLFLFPAGVKMVQCTLLTIQMSMIDVKKVEYSRFSAVVIEMPLFR